MQTELVTAIGAAATAYSVAAGLTLLLQARAMLSRGSSRDVSITFLASTSGGYLVWLVYGIGIGSLPLILADSVGAVCSAVAVLVAVRMRKRAAGPEATPRPPSRRARRAQRLREDLREALAHGGGALDLAEVMSVPLEDLLAARGDPRLSVGRRA